MMMHASLYKGMYFNYSDNSYVTWVLFYGKKRNMNTVHNNFIGLGSTSGIFSVLCEDYKT